MLIQILSQMIMYMVVLMKMHVILIVKQMSMMVHVIFLVKILIVKEIA